MAVYALGDLVPAIDPSAYVHPDAVVIGAVALGPEASIWPGAVLRGDSNRISIGARTSVQDGSVVHTASDHATEVGDDCVIGHLVHLEGCRIESGSLVGSGAIVLHGAVVHRGAVVGANAVVLDGTIVPPGALALGVPARMREGGADAALVAHGVASYRERLVRYRRDLRRLDIPGRAELL